VGESREGGGRGRQDSTDKVARTVVRDTLKSGRELSQLTVQRLTEGLFMVELFVHGEPVAERFLYAEDDLAENDAGVLPPPGERKGARRG
jgi:hypothetical protein